MPEIGQTISHYRIIEKLGQGGMGEVFLAHDTSLDRKVALKFLPDIFSGDPERLARFEREAKLLASLNHPDIAAIYGLEEAEGKRFIAMELVEGEMLAQGQLLWAALAFMTDPSLSGQDKLGHSPNIPFSTDPTGRIFIFGVPLKEANMLPLKSARHWRQLDTPLPRIAYTLHPCADS
jgi:serine/threonine protein kinase